MPVAQQTETPPIGCSQSPFEVSSRGVVYRPDVLRDAEAIPVYGEEIASTGTERRFRNDTKQEVATLRKSCLQEHGLLKVDVWVTYPAIPDTGED